MKKTHPLLTPTTHVLNSYKILILFCLLFVSLQASAVINSQVEPTQIANGQTFRIIYSFDGDATGIVPDLLPLETNFSILGTSKSTQVSIINGDIKTSTQWVVTLMPKHSGQLTIPSVSFGQQQSNSAHIQVTKSPQTNQQQQTSDRKIFLTTSVDTPTPYLHAQVIYTIKLYFATAMSKADLSTPQADNAIVKLIGKDKTYQTNYKGSLYQVVERQYAIFPQKSGQLKIEPPIFKGVIRPSSYNQVFDVLNDYQQPIQIDGKKITLDVKPQPSNFTGKTWLPAKAVNLDQSWQDLNNTIKSGTPITRTITLVAKGLLASQLPNLNFEDSDNLKVYPEKSSNKNAFSRQNIEGNKTVKVIYISSESGDITVPEIKINWWNTTTNQQETTILPAQTITVTGSMRKTPSKTQSTQINDSSKKTTTTETPNKVGKEKILPPQPNQRAWVIAALFALAWIATLLFWYFSRRKPGSIISTATPSRFEGKKQLKQACMNNDAKASRDALIAWAKQQWPQKKIYNLASLAKFLTNSEFKKQLAHLQAELYAQNSGKWQGDALWQAWMNLKQPSKPTKRKSALPPINP